MAEFCAECARKVLGLRGEFVMSKESDLCEGCGELKRVVVRVKGETLLQKIFQKQKRGK